MEQNYEKVPEVISGKDLDYLSDMFSWNYIALKKTNDAKDKVQDEEIKTILKEAFEIFDNNLNITLSILNEGGLDE